MAIRNPVIGRTAIDQGIQNPAEPDLVSTQERRALMWAAHGIWVGPQPPPVGTEVVEGEWFAGASGYWGWIQT